MALIAMAYMAYMIYIMKCNIYTTMPMLCNDLSENHTTMYMPQCNVILICVSLAWQIAPCANALPAIL